jgi:co-chaperonin GroES (HSP10)
MYGVSKGAEIFMRVLKNKILVRVIDRQDRIGSIYLPSTRSADKWEKGVVEQVGREVKGVEVGEYVLYNQFKADLHDGYRVITAEDITLIGINGEVIEESGL